MHFHWTCINHHPDGADTLIDVRNAIAGQIADLGHSQSYGDATLETLPAINIIIEGFGPRTVAWMAARHKDNCRFVTVCTERMGKESLDDAPHPDMKTRQQNLPVAAALSEAVWCLVPGTAAHLRSYCKDTRDIELGYSRTREAYLHSDVVPVHSACFYGGMLDRRRVVLETLIAGGIDICMPPKEYGRISDRNAALALSKIALGINPVPGWKIVSSSRAQSALHVGRPMLMEEVDDAASPSPWREVIRFCRLRDMYGQALDMIEHWEAERDRQLGAFREKFSAQRILAPAIEALKGMAA